MQIISGEVQDGDFGEEFCDGDKSIEKIINILHFIIIYCKQIIDFIAVVSFGLTCFSIGYTLGKDNHKSQK